MESITVNRKQQRRLEIITRVVGGSMTKGDAAEHLGVSRRQVDNILQGYQEKGLACLLHGNAGRTPVNRTPAAIVDHLAALAGEGGLYHDFSVCHLHDQLADEQGIDIGRSTVDRILKQQGIRQPRQAHPTVHRTRRDRSAAEGMLVQIDASMHDWLEGRGPRLALMGAIDDATSKILHLAFRPTEDQIGYLQLFRSVAVDYGLPQSYYHDRHTILRSPEEATIADELEGKQPRSELQRVLETLGVGSIAARSPQAKGRIERLWGTLQQRLIREMRVAGIRTLEQANLFLPHFIIRFNARFAKEPADSQSAWVPLNPDTDLAYYFSTRESRVVGNDHVVRWHNRLFLILRRPGQPSLARCRVNAHLTPEGDLHLYEGRTRLHYKELQQRPPKPQPAAADQPLPAPTKTPDPAAQRRRHAWLFAGTPADPTGSAGPLTSL